MATKRLSEIAPSAINPVAADQFVGVHGGNTDELFTLTQIAGGLSGGGFTRTILTAATTYYVRIGGSDSKNGLSPATAFATPQHAANFVCGAIDFGGQNVTIDIGTGTFGNMIFPGPTLGGGQLIIATAGAASTILQDFLNDGSPLFIFNGPIFLTLGPMTYIGAANTSRLTHIFSIGGVVLNSGAIWKPAGPCNGFAVIKIDVFTEGFSDFGFAGTYTIDFTNANGVNTPAAMAVQGNYQEFNGLWTFLGNPTFSGQGPGAIQVGEGGIYFGFFTSGGFAGAGTGQVFVCNSGGDIDNRNSTFPISIPAGMTYGSALSGGFLDGTSGGISKSGLPTTSDINPSDWAIFKDTSGGGVYAAYNDSGTIKKVALTAGIGGPILPSSVYLGGASGNLSSTVYVPVTNTNTAGAIQGVGVVASLGSNAPCVLQFNMPEIIPTGQLKLRMLAMSSANSNVAKVTVSDGQTAAGSNIGATTLTSDGQSTVTWTTADILVETKVNLSSSPGTANDILTVLVTFNSTGWTLAQISVWQFSIVWE